MNVYEQLVAVRTELQQRQAKPRTIAVMDNLIQQADSERNNPISVSQLMILRHVLRSPAVLNDEDVYLDVLSLQGDLEEAASARAVDQPAAYVDDSRRPRLHSHYKKQRKP